MLVSKDTATVDGSWLSLRLEVHLPSLSTSYLVSSASTCLACILGNCMHFLSAGLQPFALINFKNSIWKCDKVKSKGREEEMAAIRLEQDIEKLLFNKCTTTYCTFKKPDRLSQFTKCSSTSFFKRPWTRRSRGYRRYRSLILLFWYQGSMVD